MKHSKQYSTKKDADRIFNIIESCVINDFRVPFHDKHDCAMDIWINLMVDPSGKPREEMFVNSSYLSNRVKRRCLNWLSTAYKRYESCKEVPDHSKFVPVTDKRSFLNIVDMEYVVDIIGEDFVNEYFELFTHSVKKTSKLLGIPTRDVDRRRRNLLDSIKEYILNNHPELYADIRIPGKLSEHIKTKKPLSN